MWSIGNERGGEKFIYDLGRNLEDLTEVLKMGRSCGYRFWMEGDWSNPLKDYSPYSILEGILKFSGYFLLYHEKELPPSLASLDDLLSYPTDSPSNYTAIIENHTKIPSPLIEKLNWGTPIQKNLL